MTELRICFAGTPAFAAGHLQALLDAGQTPIAVYTQPDRPTGRGKKLRASPVKALALEHQLPVYQPASLRDSQVQEEFRQLQPDVLVVVAYGLILPEEILAIPRLGCINVHASLLPRWRGAAPIERAILAGDKQTGVTIMQMDAGLDTGAMLLKQALDIQLDDTGESLQAKLLEVGKQSLTLVLSELEQYQSRAEAQDDKLATYAAKLDKSEARIDWQRSAREIHQQVRAFLGRAPAWTELGDKRLRIIDCEPAGEVSDKLLSKLSPGSLLLNQRDSFDVVCGESALRVHKVQLPGKKPVSVRDLLNANPPPLQDGMLLGSAQDAGQ
ncbi:MAG: methionyl-tRNA formyltransferase [Pseudomonadales bacterium]|nr:methionyl-tRNA formyltransferase [Pseudomonadales bacterium]